MNENNIIKNEQQIMQIEKVDLIETKKSVSIFGFNLLTLVVILIIIFIIIKIINNFKYGVKNKKNK